MSNKPMYTFIIEEVSKTRNGLILNQAVIFAHDEEDAKTRHDRMYPETGKDVEFHVYPYVQMVMSAPLKAAFSGKGGGRIWETDDDEGQDDE